MRRVGRGLLRAVLLLVVLAAVGPVSSALAEQPHVTIRVPSPDAETPTIEGSAGLVAEGDNPDVSVAVFHRGGSEVGSPASVPVEQFSGEWEYKPPTLSDGEYEVVATQGNELGETGEARAVFTIEASPPVVTISVPSPKAEPRPTLEGSAGTAESVSVTITGKLTNGETFKGITAGAQVSGGRWSYAVPAPGLADGTYIAEATGTTKSGAKGKSGPASFTINTPLPVVTLSTTTFVQREKAELATNGTPRFTGTAAAGAEDSKSVTVNIYKGTTPTGTPVKVSGAVSGTAWTAGPTTALPGGPYTAQATQEDVAKNVGLSAPVTFTVDTTPPKVTLTKPASKEEVKVSKPVFSGSAGIENGDLPSVTLKIYQGTSATGTPAQTLTILPSGATWAEVGGPRFTNGTYTAVAEQSDDVGNVGKSTPTTFTIFTKSPTVTLTTVGLVSRGTTFASGPSPSFSGSAGNAPEDSSAVTVNLYSGASASGSPVRSVEGARSGTSWNAGPVAALPEGTYTAQAEQTVLPPGVTAFSNTSTFTVDTTPPQVTLTSPANGSSTTIGSQLIAGSAGTAPGDLPEVTVQLFSGAAIVGGQTPLQSILVSAAGGAWSTAVTGLGLGTYTVRAEQSDDVGNLGMSPTATFVVTKATMPPTVATGSYLSQPAPALTGAVNPNGGEVSACYFEYGNTPLYGTTVPCSELPGSGTVVVEVSAPISGLAVGGAYHFRIVAANAGGTSRGEDQTFVVAQSSPEGSSPPAAATEGSSAPAAATTQRALILSPAQGVLPSQEHKLSPVPDVELASTSLAVSRSGAFSVKVTCPAGESSCTGTVTFRTLNAVSASANAHQSKKPKAVILTIAVGSFKVMGGEVEAVKLHLSAKARALLRRTHVLQARATIEARDFDGRYAHNPDGRQAPRIQAGAGSQGLSETLHASC